MANKIKQKKKPAAQDQVGKKVNAGIMDAICYGGGGMCEEENHANKVIYITEEQIKHIREELHKEKYIENKYGEKWVRLQTSSDIFKKCNKIVKDASNDKTNIGLMDVAEVEGDKHYIAIIHGGLNGRGEWVNYINSIAKILKKIHGSYIVDLDVDVLDDVWTLQIGFHKEQLSEGAWGVKPEQSDSYLDLSHELGEPIINILAKKLPEVVNHPKDNDGNIYYWLGLMLDMLKVRAFDESWLYRNSDEGRKDNKYKIIRELFKCANKGFDYLLTDSVKENRQGWEDFEEYEKYMKKMYDEFKKLEDYYNMDKDDPKGADKLIRESQKDAACPDCEEYELGVEPNSISAYAHVCEDKEKSMGSFPYKKYMLSLLHYMDENGIKVKPYPKVVMNKEPQTGLYIRTGYYEPEIKSVTLFIDGRHPKDIMRSFAHEMIHHNQNLMGMNLSFTNEDNVEDNKNLEKLEADAYLRGNVIFRKWTEHQNKKSLNESVNKQEEKTIRNSVREMIKSGELPLDYNGHPLEMAEHYVKILKHAFGPDYEYKPFEDDEIRCAIIDDEFRKNGGKQDLDGVENHENSIEKNLDKIINESMETEIVKPEDIDLSSFNLKTKLNPKFWDKGHLDSRIRMKLFDIADDFIETLGLDDSDIEDIVITGSLANYNWNERYSDIDLHILVDYDNLNNDTELLKDYFDAKKRLWNESHKDIQIFGFPVEVYVEDINEKHNSRAIYSLERDKWIEEPSMDNLASQKINKQYIKEKVSQYTDKIDKLLVLSKKYGNDSYKLEKIYNKCDKLWDCIKRERINGFKEKDSEINNGNLIFKTLRRMDYIEKIATLKSKIYDKLKSLE